MATSRGRSKGTKAVPVNLAASSPATTAAGASGIPKQSAASGTRSRRAVVVHPPQVKRPATGQRPLPTHDWTSQIDRAHIQKALQVQRLAAVHFYQGLVNLKSGVFRELEVARDRTVLAATLRGVLRLPSGQAAARMEVSAVLPGIGIGGVTAAFAASYTNAVGEFSLLTKAVLEVEPGSTLTLLIRGGNGVDRCSVPLTPLALLGALGDVQLHLELQPLPTSVIASLNDIATGMTALPTPPPQAGSSSRPIQVRLGDDGQGITFAQNVPQESHAYSMLVRLIEPRVSVLNDVYMYRDNSMRGGSLWFSSRNDAFDGSPGVTRSFTERVPIDQPISVDGFRDLVRGERDGTICELETVPMAATLGLGYLVHMGQQWTPSGYSLGDLVYSLPLSPGEQQRVAVFEQTQTLTTTDMESMTIEEQQAERARSDSSTNSVFQSAFQESVTGTSSFSTDAEASGWGASLGVSGSIKGVIFGLGGGYSHGRNESSGQSSNTLEGSRDFASKAAADMHNAVEKQASARRQAQRVGVRLATGSDSEQVTTKVITNNNRVHALTMQYWEVLRHFNVSTAINGISLVCFVPLQVLRFIPPRQPVSLESADLSTRAAVLTRYSVLTKHIEILQRWLPPPLLAGLKVLEQFAANPKAIPVLDGVGLDVISLSLHGTFVPNDQVFVTVLARRGARLGPFRLTGNVAHLPELANDPDHAFATRAELINELHRRRTADTGSQLSATIALPESVAVDDVIGFEFSRVLTPLRYKLAPSKDASVTALESAPNIPTGAIDAISAHLRSRLNGVSLDARELEQEIGCPLVWDLEARTLPAPSEPYVTAHLSLATRIELATAGYLVPALSVKARLRVKDLLEIEKTLQHIARNTVTYSKAVWSSLTHEELAIMLEGFTIGVPADGISDDSQHIPLLNCVATQVLGFYGNSLILPFAVPPEIAAKLGGSGEGGKPLTTGKIQAALMRFYRNGFFPPNSGVALPTRGVVGEAVLGNSPSAEKIDLTRFWNWEDSPLPQAADVAGGLLNRGNLLVGTPAPSSLTGMPAMITNVNSAPTADSADVLKSLLSARETRGFEDITGSKDLALLQGKAVDSSEKARADALAKSQELAKSGMEQAAKVLMAKNERDSALAQKAAAERSAADKAAAGQATSGQAPTALQTLKQNAGAMLDAAESRSNQNEADVFAKDVVDRLFGADGVPITAAVQLSGAYHKVTAGSSNPTQGSLAFMRAFGLRT